MIVLWNGAKAAVGTAVVTRDSTSGVPGIGAGCVLKREIEALRVSISRLNATNQRISESPDLETALREAL